MTFDPKRIVQSLNERVDDILDRCTACGACVDVCPTPAIDGLDVTDSGFVAKGVLDVLKTGHGPLVSEKWITACCASGFCKSACEEGINPRFMLAMAKRRLKQNDAAEDRKAKGKADFKYMSQGVKLISRLQLPSDLMARLSPSSHPQSDLKTDVVFYTGCNLLKTPHIGLLCLDVLDQLGFSFEVHGGPANCCGILQMWAGDDENSARQGGKTIKRLSESGAQDVLSWCPTCEIQFNENLLPSYQDGAQSPFSMTMFPIFLTRHLGRLKPLLKYAVNKRVALHEYPGSIGVVDAVKKLLTSIDGLEVVDLEMDKVGYQLATLTNKDFAKKHLNEFLDRAEKEKVDCFVGIYHSDHRELVRHEPVRDFEVVNYMDLIGEAMGIARDDLFKKLRLMEDADQILAEQKSLIAAHGLKLDDVREIILQQVLGEAILPIDPA